MSVFVDTSAFMALLDRTEPEHGSILRAWERGNEDAEGFFTTNYVALESIAVAQRRWGMAAVRALIDEFLPLVDVVWTTPDDHDAGVDALLAADRRRLSLVDCVSFVVMRRLAVRLYLAIDPHFAEQGFESYAAALG
ncbi:MAG TPA: PIN domain-containing protein [Thermoleophilia bacterium]|nr:PIN domain-containing protein [Thermoleophilia bacterium]HQG04390.1 PIN domain-containing protein [Thermoleophilia bacterium]HQJ98559.1 PIN domain-containing protein [Thermoleophilia bacterium]